MSSLPPLEEDYTNNWTALAGLSTQPSQPLNFGTYDLAAYDFAPLDLGLGSSSMPFDMATQAQAPLGFGTGDLAVYNFSLNIGIAGPYGPPVSQPNPFFQMGLGGSMANASVPGAAVYASTRDEGTIEYGAASSRSSLVEADSAVGSTSTSADAMRTEPAQSATDPQPWSGLEWALSDWLLEDMRVAGHAMASPTTPTSAEPPAVPAADVAPASPPAAMPALDPSVLRRPSPEMDGEQPTAWLEGGELFWHSAGLGYLSDEALARTSSSVASPASGVESGPAVSMGTSVASGHSYNAYAPSAQHSEQLGLNVQADNTVLTPAVTGLQPKTAQAATSSRKAASPKAPRSSKVHEKKATKARASTSTRTRVPKRPKNPFPRIPWEKTERGRRCEELGLTHDKPGPFQCFVCVEHGAPGASKVYNEWERFKSHVGRCAPLESMKPRCHFCHKANTTAYARPHQMERHLVGYGGYPACKALAKLVRAGRTTHFEIGSWLKKKGRPIVPEFLGRRLAKAFHWAVENNWERDKVADLTPQHRKKKRKQANKEDAADAAEQEVEDADDESDDDEDEE